MDELMNLMIADESPSEISDSIKNQLFAKAGARVDAVKPAVANAMLGYEIESEEDAELMQERLGLVATADPYIGRYYSTDYIRRKILRQTDEEIVEQNTLMAQEKDAGIIPPTEQEMQMADTIIQSQASEIEPEVDTSSVGAPESPEVPKGGEI